MDRGAADTPAAAGLIPVLSTPNNPVPGGVMRVPAVPYHGSVGIEENEHGGPRTGICSAVIPLAAIACLGLWVLAIWTAVDLIGGA
jgi:hypothetical protein